MKGKRLFKNKVHELDFMTASIIFLASCIELMSWHFQETDPVPIKNADQHMYLIWWYPLLNTWTVWLFSFYFLLKICRFNACIYTKIVTVTYFILQTIALSAFYIGFGLDMYELIAYPCILYGIVSLTLIRVIRWFSR